MMPALKPPSPLIDRLPAVRGRITANASLAAITWFGVGGPAEVMFRPLDAEDLGQFLNGLPDDVPVTVIGVASNLLVRDGGIEGVVIRLGRDFAGIRPEPEHAGGPRLVAGAAALDVNVATIAAEAGIAGLEFLTGIPGTIGGAVRMNAGAYGSDMAAITRSAQAIDRSGTIHELAPDALDFTYRHSAVPEDWIVTGAVLAGQPGNPAAIRGRLMQIREERERTQPIRAKTGGSTFKNPPGHKAWELIDKAGCRGLRLGAAQVSEKHTNFLINVGGATAAEIEELGETVRRRVFDMSGVQLEWEIRRVGEPA